MPRGAKETEFGTLKVNPMFRDKIDYEMGKENTTESTAPPISQKEILEDIFNNLGDVTRIGNVPDVVIKSRSVVEKIPKKLEEFKMFQGSENVFYHQKSYGNFVRKLRRASGISILANPYRFMQSDLLAHGILSSPFEPVMGKIRSTLKTEYLYLDATGYNELGDTGILTAEQELVANKWWTDIGKPTAFQINYDSSGTQGQIYRLLRRKCLVGV